MTVRIQRWPLRTGDAWRVTVRYRGRYTVAYAASRADAVRDAILSVTP